MTNFLELQGFDSLQEERHIVNKDLSLRLVTTMTTYPIAHKELKKAFDELKQALEAREINLQELDYLENVVNKLSLTTMVIKCDERYEKE